MKRSLSVKMLLLSLGSSMVLIAGILAFLQIYFSRFYEPVKINRLVGAINAFSESYGSGKWSDEQLFAEVSAFMKQQNATMSISDAFTATAVFPMAEAVQVTAAGIAATGSTVDIVAIGSSTDINAAGSTAGEAGIAGEASEGSFADTVTISGSPGQGLTSASAVLLRAEPVSGYVFTDALPAVSAFDPAMGWLAGTDIVSQGVVEVPAEISDVQPGKRSISMATSTLINGMTIFYPVGELQVLEVGMSPEVRERAGVRYSVGEIPASDIRQVDFVRQVTLKDGQQKGIYVNVSLQSVHEVGEVLGRFFPFLILFAAVLSLLMSRIYARTVVQPISRISGVANRMANMDFGAVSDCASEDELGRLSTSINKLSANLRSALDDLTVANGQLREDYEQKVRQEQARKEFVANVSHELKTPLGVIKSYSEGIRDGVRTEKRDYYASVILDEVDRMDHLVQEMLEISKLDAGADSFEKREVEALSLVNQVTGGFEPFLEEREMRLVVEGEFGIVVADSRKIIRVLGNLLGNAVKYGRPGTAVKLRGERVSEGLRLLVENECSPLSEAQLERIWDRFYKGDASHNRDAEGTGLGLAIVRSILEGHGCPYGAGNTEHGVMFFFTLPFA